MPTEALPAFDDLPMTVQYGSAKATQGRDSVDEEPYRKLTMDYPKLNTYIQVQSNSSTRPQEAKEAHVDPKSLIMV